MRVEETDEYAAWMTELRDFAGRRRIMVRVDTLLRADLLVLLTGGAKDTQVRDVRKATLLVRQYKEQTT